MFCVYTNYLMFYLRCDFQYVARGLRVGAHGNGLYLLSVFVGGVERHRDESLLAGFYLVFWEIGHGASAGGGAFLYKKVGFSGVGETETVAHHLAFAQSAEVVLHLVEFYYGNFGVLVHARSGVGVVYHACVHVGAAVAAAAGYEHCRCHKERYN